MGLTPALQLQLHNSYVANMAVIYDELLKRGQFSWQQLWNGQGSPDDKNGCCTSPLVRQGSQCAPALRALCTANSPAQTRYYKYAFTPGGCRGDPGNLTDPIQDIVNFQLTCVKGRWPRGRVGAREARAGARKRLRWCFLGAHCSLPLCPAFAASARRRTHTPATHCACIPPRAIVTGVGRMRCWATAGWAAPTRTRCVVCVCVLRGTRAGADARTAGRSAAEPAVVVAVRATVR